ncbi:bifunctional epoxide hydrolase 2 [Anguilla anguilla]|uniref:bifunctional epoxide hydrolase 2 n=1 Tax=Anguilla anguilla TaxID=7936 RepID=UPI0015AD1F48|nr:bifunctional epoxide hydrolase 2 [Anguilla anguilla]XP_035241470.1 bifunctional epoxide hydrolase 2 [Anguilla anguilla]
MAARKAVLFDLWGCVQTPRLHHIFKKYEESLGLPRNFIHETVVKGGPGSALHRAELGKLTLTQMIPEMEAECLKEASSQAVSLPPQFSVQKLFDQIREALRFNTAILEASDKLRRHGVATCVLGNSWVDDSEKRDWMGLVLLVLQLHFDLVFQSCRTGARLPDPTLFSHALQRLGATPQQAVFVSSVEESVAAGRDIGMAVVLMDDSNEALKHLQCLAGMQAILVSSVEERETAGKKIGMGMCLTEDPNEAMLQLQSLSGVELLSSEETCSLCCNPEDVPHCFVTIKPGHQVHYVDMGEGPAVLLCHGFPDSWFSWRYQILALAESGFRVLALDMKGYGDSLAPPDIEEYSQEQLCQDLITFLDKLGIVQVTLVGHDWGGSLVWNMAQCHPERVRAVASLNTPLFLVDPNTNPMERLKANPTFNYQIYFQTPGVAEAELEKDLARTFKIMFRDAAGNVGKGLTLSSANVCERGGLFVGLPDDIPLSPILSEDALQYYIKQFSKTGFRGPLNWYRNTERNWRWMSSRPRGKILMPSLMVTAGMDQILLPKFSSGMETMIPNLTRGHIEDCGHWTQIERPVELNKILLSWLKDVHQKAAIPLCPKL